jgi:hypothetical protein
LAATLTAGERKHLGVLLVGVYERESSSLLVGSGQASAKNF